MINAIELKHICKNYGRFSLQDVSLCVPQGSIVGLVGENGAGKSTLIKMVLSLRQADSGDIQLFQKPLQSLTRSDREKIGVVFDEGCFPDSFTVKQVRELMRRAFDKAWDDRIFSDYLVQFALPEQEVYSKFSKGMKMKLAIAVALSHHAQILILDEATSGLDPFIREEIIGILSEFTRNPENSILISSHIVTDLEKLCDYIAFLHNGRMIVFEEKDALIEQYGLFTGSADEVAALPAGAIIGIRENKYAAQALLARSKVDTSVPLEKCSLEEIIIFLSKSEGIA